MQNPCQSIEDEITTIDEQIDSLTNPELPHPLHADKLLARLEAERTQLQRELKLCLDPCQPIEDQIATDQAQIATLTTQIGGLTLQITQLNTQIAAWQTQIAQLQTDIQQRQQALLQCQQAHRR